MPITELLILKSITIRPKKIKKYCIAFIENLFAKVKASLGTYGKIDDYLDFLNYIYIDFRIFCCKTLSP